MSESILIREVGPREGFQTIARVIPTADKIALIDALSETGIREMEIASFVRSDRVPQMADAEEIAGRYRRKEGVHYFGLYLNQRGFERAELTRRLDNKGWIYSAASAEFLKSNNNTSAEEVIASIRAWIDLFDQYGKSLHGVMISAAFGYSNEGRFNSQRVVDVLTPLLREIERSGATLKEISLADTVGIATPDQVRRTVSVVKERFPAHEISLHLHDTRGAGLANAYAGYLEGVRIFESSVGGMGGCPFAKGASGNIVTEDLIELFEASGISTGLDLKRYIDAARLAERITGMQLPGKLMRMTC